MNSFIPRSARYVLVAVALFLVALPGMFAGTAFSRIVVFGDSLNDSGNMVQFTGGVFPAAPTHYAYGRQSNGPVWVEYLADRLGMKGQISNYAVVGALTRPTAAWPTGNVWSDTFPGLEGTDVTSQVQDYLRDNHGAADPNALIVLEGGANDLIQGVNPAVIIQNLATCYGMLEQAGAKHIVFVLLPDFGKAPRAVLAERMGLAPPGTTTAYTQACALINAALRGTLTSITVPGVTLTYADMFTFLDAVVASPSTFGMTEVVMPYLLVASGDPAAYLFWDDVHPTTHGHQLFAEAVIDSLVATYSPRQGIGNGSGVINGLRGLVKAPGGG